MSSTLVERIAKSKERTAKLEKQRRAELRKEREAQKKKDQRRNYIIGELVTKYFQGLCSLEPGTKAENADRFTSLEALLSVLAADHKLMEKLMAKARYSVPLQKEEGSTYTSEGR